MDSQRKLVRTVMVSFHNALFDLPNFLLVHVLIDWVDLYDIGCLDSACCNKECRRQFLDVVRADRFTVAEMVIPTHFTSYLQWHSRRKVKFGRFVMEIEADINVLTDFLGAVGGNHVCSIHFSGIKSSVKDVLTLIGSTCKMVKNVFIEDCDDILGLDLWLLNGIKTLRKLTIINCDLGYAAKYANLSLPSLEHIYLDLACVDFIESKSLLKHFFNASRVLTNVHVMNGNVHADNLRGLCRSSSTLQELEIHGSTYTTHWDLHSLSSRSCTALRHLQLTRCAGITDTAVLPFLTHCPLLEAIMLTKPVTDKTLLAIAEHCGARLRHLSFFDIKCDGDTAVDALAVSCRHLVSLNINVQGVSHAALARLISAQKPGLTQLALSPMPLNSAIIEAVVSTHHAARLTYVDLRECTGYTSSDLARLAQECTALRCVAVEEESPIINESARCLWQAMRPNLQFQHEDFCPPYWTYVPA